MTSITRTSLALLVLTVGIIFSLSHVSNEAFVAQAQSTTYKKAPEFPQTSADQWLNSPPLSMASLRGKVVMIDFWTFGCWNCYRSFPWMNEMEARLEGEEFQIIGVHTPEFEHEKVRASIEKKIDEFELRHPTVMDNDFRYWRAMNNRYWPTYYLIDKKGNIRDQFIGETHANTAKAEKIEDRIKELLAE